MNVKEVQLRLWRESREHRDYRLSGNPDKSVDPYKMRIGGLSDFLHNPAWSKAAAEDVLRSSRNKAVGIDKVSVQQFEEKMETNLEALRHELKRGTYRPRPTRRTQIPKANGTMRPLGILCLSDKIVQEAVKRLLEPIFEVEFHDSSYGFRKNRNTQQAVSRCRELIRHGYCTVIEGDVKACFDEISHKAILSAIRERISDQRLIELIRLLLKAGVNVEGRTLPTVKGTPQGGIISPLLANILLNKLDWFLHGKYQTMEGRMQYVRYADDWCVFLKGISQGKANQLKEEIAVMLKKTCSLELSGEKTRITEVRTGFQFLGFKLIGEGAGANLTAKVTITDKKKEEIKVRMSDEVRSITTPKELKDRLEYLNSVINGIGESLRIADDYRQAARELDDHVHAEMADRICSLWRISLEECRRRQLREGTFHVEGKNLASFSALEPRTNIRPPRPYEP